MLFFQVKSQFSHFQSPLIILMLPNRRNEETSVLQCPDTQKTPFKTKKLALLHENTKLSVFTIIKKPSVRTGRYL